jgi:hypothetical protein
VVSVDDNHVVTVRSVIPLDALMVGLRSQPSVPPVAAAPALGQVGSDLYQENPDQDGQNASGESQGSRDFSGENQAGQSQAGAAHIWRVRLTQAPDSPDALRLVATAGGARYYGEASLTFTDPAEDYQ